ncbi:hypothetical protein Misp01_27620 [Microtetraspora sp. NBRC 13810]|uniref:hypothetical protein n=1 Tax=Microtetraspora sp. NBRC 13810 TaxID=3030990 RepID=UPI0024A3918D|nr:hypothetical protein [Microtetraspora sp. NBRC 13810]GLW07632.1 hypothetical protein Misp01_27620 [Microtetraspora sp. NBRC 13810]
MTLIRRLGVEDLPACQKLALDRGWAPDEVPGVREAAPEDFAAVVALDAEVAGADRTVVLAPLLGRAEKVVVADGGFAIAWNTAEQRVIGPVAAPSEEAARALIAAAAHGADREVRVEVLGAFPGVGAWLAAHGMRATGDPLATMLRGTPRPPGDRARYVAPILLSLG